MKVPPKYLKMVSAFLTMSVMVTNTAPAVIAATPQNDKDAVVIEEHAENTTLTQNDADAAADLQNQQKNEADQVQAVDEENQSQQSVQSETLKEAASTADDIFPAVIYLNKDKATLVKGDTVELKINSYTGGATNLNVTWSSSEPSVAAVDENGVVTAEGAGTAIITATSTGNAPGEAQPAKATCAVSVKGVDKNYEYSLNEDGTVTITDYKGTDPAVVIPSEIDGKSVAALDGYSFWMDDNLTSVVIPEGVKSIGKYAFNASKNITSITVPSTVTTIGDAAFRMTAITSMTIPEGVKSIGRDLFNGCKQLTDVKLPSSITALNPNAFAGCDSLKEITLPDDITYYGTNALRKIEKIYVVPGSKTAETLADKDLPVADVVYPTFISLNESKKNLVQGEILSLRVNGYSANATNIDVKWSSSDENLATVDDSGKVTAVGAGSAVITATSVGNESAKATCTVNVKGVDGNYEYSLNEDNTVTITGYNGRDKEAAIPATLGGMPVTIIGALSFWVNDSLTKVVIPDGITVIEHEAFNADKNLKEVQLPSTLQKIDRRAFWGTALTDVTVPEGVTAIGNEAYSDCRQLGSIALPQSLTSLGANVFASCDKLTSITLPDNIESVGTNVFGKVGEIKAYPGTKTAETLKKAGIAYVDANVYPTELILNEDKMTLRQNDTEELYVMGYAPGETTDLSVNFASSDPRVASVDENGKVTALKAGTAVITAASKHNADVKAECTVTVAGVLASDIEYQIDGDHIVITGYEGSAETLTIPEEIDGLPVTTIGAVSLWFNDHLKSVILPEGITAIEHEAFANCKNLESISLPAGIQTIGKRAFYNTALKTVELKDGLASIGIEAFCNNKNLTEVTLPESLADIGVRAFENCPDLAELTVPVSVTSIGTDAFKDGPQLLKVYPDSYALTYAVENNLKYEIIETAQPVDPEKPGDNNDPDKNKEEATPAVTETANVSTETTKAVTNPKTGAMTDHPAAAAAAAAAMLAGAVAGTAVMGKKKKEEN